MIDINTNCGNETICKIYYFFRKFIKYSFNVILAILVAFTLVTSYKAINPLDRYYETQDFLGFQMFGIKSDSMYPTIKTGDAVLMKITKDDTDIEEDDIVAYKMDKDTIIVHRVKEKINEEEYITKGDNNNTEDGVIYREEIFAKHVLTVPKLQVYLNLINPKENILGFITFVVLAISLFFFFDSITEISDDYFNYNKGKKKKDDKEEE